MKTIEPITEQEETRRGESLVSGLGLKEAKQYVDKRNIPFDPPRYDTAWGTQDCAWPVPHHRAHLSSDAARGLIAPFGNQDSSPLSCLEFTPSVIAIREALKILR